MNLPSFDKQKEQLIGNLQSGLRSKERQSVNQLQQNLANSGLSQGGLGQKMVQSTQAQYADIGSKALTDADIQLSDMERQWEYNLAQYDNQLKNILFGQKTQNAQGEYQANLNQAQAKAQHRSALTGGLMGLAGAGIGAYGNIAAAGKLGQSSRYFYVPTNTIK